MNDLDEIIYEALKTHFKCIKNCKKSNHNYNGYRFVVITVFINEEQYTGEVLINGFEMIDIINKLSKQHDVRILFKIKSEWSTLFVNKCYLAC